MFALAPLLACASTVVDHEAVSRAHTPEYFSFSSIEVVYPSDLTSEQEVLVHRYQPGDEVARKVRAWFEETGMWSGRQALRLELHSVRLPARWQWDTYRPLVIGSGVGYRGEDHLDLRVEVLQEQKLLHRMGILRTFPVTNRTIQQVLSSKRAIDDLTSDVAWQIVFELTPPGYDEAIILAGHRDGVATATLVAERRGLLSYGELLKDITTGQDQGSSLVDTYCAATLAKPGWMPWWLWADPVSWKKCKERAEEDARRR
jgi:hypothetical protein